LDDLCDTRDTLAVGVGNQLHDGRVHPYFARRSGYCAGAGPFSEAMTAVNDLLNNCFYIRRKRRYGQ
jgi:hypothetical protein